MFVYLVDTLEFSLAMHILNMKFRRKKTLYVVCFKLDIVWLNELYCQAQWCMPVIPALWEAKVCGSQRQEFKTSLAKLVKPHLY